MPVGLIGLYLVWRYLPDYREDKTNPLDIVGLVLFGSGVALLSYVLEVFGEHRLGDLEILGLLGAVRAPAGRLRRQRHAHAVSAAAARPVPPAHLSRRGRRQLLQPARAGRHSVPVPAAVPDRHGLHAGAVRPAGDAPGDGGDGAEADRAEDPGALRLSHRAGRQHADPRRADHGLRHHRRRHAVVAHRAAVLHPGLLHLDCNTPP